ncbi:hypothetical protein [Mongoliitalea daihaiensis]|uniref:hypothetical protein n=1 Tax=Mongoliitalea daihaiensis TaxID=2782006 RepID=UPI001F45ACAA|nr:hypothetical protein [Mongoliitalea daihaiensis]UJP63722.1 hypothetical protein IPZ59_12875 [Mongoliitalea daihaiensis]
MKKVLLSFLIGLAAFACIPEETNSPQNPVVNNPLEISAPVGFTWTTTRSISVTLDKIFLPSSLVRTLVLKDGDGTQLFKGSHDLTQDFSLTVTVPNHVNKLVMEIGEVLLEKSITGSSMAFTFPVIEPSND